MSLDKLMKDAQDGVPSAQYQLGRALFYGEEVILDRKKGMHWLEEAVKRGETGAMLELAAIYHGGAGVPEDPARALELYQKAAALDNSEAQFRLALAYFNGDGTEMIKAVYWLRRAAESKYPPAIEKLGLMYHAGEVFEQDMVKGACLMHVAANHGLASARTTLGKWYGRGQGVEKNMEQAAYWYKLAADQDDPEGQWYLGHHYQSGAGVPQDMEKALYWITRAAEGGWDQARVNLASLYRDGSGVEKDMEKAVQWLERAAADGNGVACLELARIFRKDVDTPGSREKMVEWLEKGAELGQLEAQTLLAEHLLECGADMEQVMRWAEQPARRGIARAQYFYGRALLGQMPDEAAYWLECAAMQDLAEAKIMLEKISAKKGKTGRD